MSSTPVQFPIPTIAQNMGTTANIVGSWSSNSYIPILSEEKVREIIKEELEKAFEKFILKNKHELKLDV